MTESIESIEPQVKNTLDTFRAKTNDFPSDPEEEERFVPLYENGYQIALPEEILSSRRARIGIPKALNHCTFENYICGNFWTKALWNGVTRWLINLPGNYGTNEDHSLLIIGGPGVGKSHLATAAIKELALNGYRPRFVDVPELLGELRQAWDFSLVVDWIEPDVVLFDDLGAADGNATQLERLRIILSKRYAEQKPTILTTNLKREELKEQLGERIDSRISQSYVVVEADKRMNDWRRRP